MVMGLPPLLVGGMKFTIACAFPALAKPIDGAPGIVAATAISNDRDTSAAEVKVAFPDCLAMISQAPAASKVTVVPVTAQMVGVGVENETGRPELAFAEMTIGESLSSLGDNGAKVID